LHAREETASADHWAECRLKSPRVPLHTFTNLCQMATALEEDARGDRPRIGSTARSQGGALFELRARVAPRKRKADYVLALSSGGLG
jgi:hypothetical protein